MFSKLLSKLFGPVVYLRSSNGREVIKRFGKQTKRGILVYGNYSTPHVLCSPDGTTTWRDYPKWTNEKIKSMPIEDVLYDMYIKPSLPPSFRVKEQDNG